MTTPIARPSSSGSPEKRVAALDDLRAAELFNRIPRSPPSKSLLYLALKLVLSLGTLTVLIIGYALAIQVITIGSVTSIGCYGLAIVVDYLVQLSGAFANRHDVNRIVARRQAENQRQRTATLGELAERGEVVDEAAVDTLLCPDGSVSVAVVGYREDVKAWRDCLCSLQKQTLKPRVIIAVVDGNQEPDQEMANAFLEEFAGRRARLIDLPSLLSAQHRRDYNEALVEEAARRGAQASSTRRSAKIWRWLKGKYTPEQEEAHRIAFAAAIKQIQDWKVEFDISDDLEAVCFTQPHGHKRTAMFTAFMMCLYALETREGIFTTDSDTLVKSDALDELLCLLRSEENLGGVTGEVKIWNASTSWLTRMCMVRYWMAFNVERGCQSIWRCVSCLSGPMALYRACDLNDVLGRWNVQSFGGVETTFGDDRHMTNQILATGRHTRHTHRTWCDSESPENFVRWIRQQTRWSKSFYRELFWFPCQFVYQSWWLLFEVVKQACFPFILISTLFHMFFTPTNAWRPLVWTGTIGLMALIKSVVALVVTGDPWMLAFAGYGFVYFFGLLPTKVWALFTLTRNTWGTSARTQSERKKTESFRERSFHVAYLCLWFFSLAAGITFYTTVITGSPLCLLVLAVPIPFSVNMYVDDWASLMPWRKSGTATIVPVEPVAEPKAVSATTSVENTSPVNTHVQVAPEDRRVSIDMRPSEDATLYSEEETLAQSIVEPWTKVQSEQCSPTSERVATVDAPSIVTPPTEIVMSPTEIVMSPTELAVSPTEIAVSPTEIVTPPPEIVTPPTEQQQKLAPPPLASERRLSLATQHTQRRPSLSPQRRPSLPAQPRASLSAYTSRRPSVMSSRRPSMLSIEEEGRPTSGEFDHATLLRPPMPVFGQSTFLGLPSHRPKATPLQNYSLPFGGTDSTRSSISSISSGTTTSRWSMFSSRRSSSRTISSLATTIDGEDEESWDQAVKASFPGPIKSMDAKSAGPHATSPFADRLAGKGLGGYTQGINPALNWSALYRSHAAV